MYVFNPIIMFFGKLKFRYKILVMIFAVLIPFIIPSYFTYKKLADEIYVVDREKRAIAYINPIIKLLKLIPEHRGLMEGYFGEKIFSNHR